MVESDFYAIKYDGIKINEMNRVKIMLEAVSFKKVLISSKINSLETIIFVKYIGESINVENVLKYFPDTTISYGDNAIDEYLAFLDEFINN